MIIDDREIEEAAEHEAALEILENLVSLPSDARMRPEVQRLVRKAAQLLDQPVPDVWSEGPAQTGGVGWKVVP